MDNKQIATFIKKRRKQLSLTQIELATLSNISTRKLSDIETANGATTIDILNKVCDILGVEIDLNIKSSNKLHD
ncbi:MAG: helix-turn-helix domain-containing protein [Arcobacteraceae bacterium]